MPPLLSKKSHSLLGVVIDCVNDTLSSKKLGIKAYGLSTTEGGHYMMKVNEFQHVATDHEPLNLQMDVNDEVGLILDNAGSVAQEAFNAQSSSFPDVLLHGGEPTESSSMPDLRQVGASHQRLPGSIAGRGLCEDQHGVHGEASGARDPRRRHQDDCEKGGTQEHGSESVSEGISRQAQHGESQEGSQRIGGGASSIAADSNFAGQVDMVAVEGLTPDEITISVLGQCMEQRPGDEHHEERAESPSSSTVEEGGLADACEKAVEIEGHGKLKWRRNSRWISLMIGTEVATLWGHFGAMRQKMRAPDVVPRC